MDHLQTPASNNWIKYGLIGFMVGACFVSITTAGLFASEVANPPPTPTLLPTPTLAAQVLLDQADEAMYVNGDSQFVLDTLGPNLAQFSNPEDQAKAMELMAMAEMALGHYQLSASYLERLCQLSPIPANYATLARVYDAGGDLEHALANYLIYLEMDDPARTEDIQIMVEDRVSQIQSILTRITPTPGP